MYIAHKVLISHMHSWAYFNSPTSACLWIMKGNQCIQSTGRKGQIYSVRVLIVNFKAEVLTPKPLLTAYPLNSPRIYLDAQAKSGKVSERSQAGLMSSVCDFIRFHNICTQKHSRRYGNLGTATA